MYGTSFPNVIFSVVFLGAAVGLYVGHYQHAARGFKLLGIPDLNIDDVNLFERDEFMFFDWGVYVSFIAIASGVFATILAGVALLIMNANNKYEQFV